jgi:hypothetical protein
MKENIQPLMKFAEKIATKSNSTKDLRVFTSSISGEIESQQHYQLLDGTDSIPNRIVLKTLRENEEFIINKQSKLIIENNNNNNNNNNDKDVKTPKFNTGLVRNYNNNNNIVLDDHQIRKPYQPIPNRRPEIPKAISYTPSQELSQEIINPQENQPTIDINSIPPQDEIALNLTIPESQSLLLSSPIIDNSISPIIVNKSSSNIDILSSPTIDISSSSNDVPIVIPDPNVNLDDPLLLSEWPAFLWSHCRVKVCKSLPSSSSIIASKNGRIVCWIQHSLRINDNLALLTAIYLSNKLKIPLIAIVRILLLLINIVIIYFA